MLFDFVAAGHDRHRVLHREVVNLFALKFGLTNIAHRNNVGVVEQAAARASAMNCSAASGLRAIWREDKIFKAAQAVDTELSRQIDMPHTTSANELFEAISCDLCLYLYLINFGHC